MSFSSPQGMPFRPFSYSPMSWMRSPSVSFSLVRGAGLLITCLARSDRSPTYCVCSSCSHRSDSALFFSPIFDSPTFSPVLLVFAPVVMRRCFPAMFSVPPLLSPPTWGAACVPRSRRRAGRPSYHLRSLPSARGHSRRECVDGSGGALVSLIPRG